MLNAASTLLQDSHRAVALRLNPLNAEARVGMALHMLQEKSASQAQLEGTITTGIRFAPADARFYSLLGLAKQRSGETVAAQQLFDYALQRLPTEIQALLQKLIHDTQTGDLAASARHVEMIGRRWDEYWPNVTPLLPVLLSNRDVFLGMAERFGRDERLRRLLIRSLAKKEQTLSLAHRLLLHWYESSVDDLTGHINHVTARLIRHQRYAEAFLLFRSSAIRSSTAWGRPESPDPLSP